MFDFLKGGIKNKGRFFKNSNFGLLGKGGRNMKKVFAVFALFCALVLTGWGCKKAPTPADTGVEEPKVEDAGASEEGDEIPTGWKEYRNEDMGFMFWYPKEWSLRVVDELFTWGDDEYELVDVQLADPESGHYIGAYSFAIAENPEKQPLTNWLEKHNTVGDPFTLVDEVYNEAIPGKKFVYEEGVTLAPDQYAFPASSLVFANQDNSRIFFPDLGQDHSIFEVYGISAEEFASQIRSTFRFVQ